MPNHNNVNNELCGIVQFKIREIWVNLRSAEECVDTDFLPKSGQTRSCHLVRTHNMATYEAFDKGLH